MSFLRQVPLFGGLKDEELEELAGLMQMRRYKRGSFIVLAEEQGDEFFVIRKGRVKVNIVHADGREIILSLLDQGEVFGELALLDGRPRSANVVALETTELAVLRRESFVKLLHENPRIAVPLLAELAGRLRRTDVQIEGLALMNVASRLARTILQLVVEKGRETEEGMLLEKRPTHQELARMTGTTRETVTRVMGRLEREGYICCQGRRILVYKEAYEEQ
jgi:CRP-like cAMP-binding protein